MYPAVKFIFDLQVTGSSGVWSRLQYYVTQLVLNHRIFFQELRKYVSLLKIVEINFTVITFLHYKEIFFTHTCHSSVEFVKMILIVFQ